MSAHRLYHTWFCHVRKLLPDERITRVRNLVWMIVGLYLSQSVHLSRIAAKLPFCVRLTSTLHRFRRFLNNPAFRVRQWYRTLAQDLLVQTTSSGSVRLILDGSKVGAGHQLLMVSLAYRKRALPITWTWVRGGRGHSSSTKQLALLSYIHDLLPGGATVEVVGDNEFGSIALLRQLERWRWRYVLRQKGNTLACVSKKTLAWRRFDSLVPSRNQLFWYPNALLTLKHLHHTHLLAYWETREDGPWLLATNIPQAPTALRSYRRRMWIEEMFGDWKGHGVNLEKTHLRHFQRLSRLTFVVALLYLWLVTRGSQAIKSGTRCLVDRTKRRDLSVFRIGLYTIDRRYACNQPFSIRLIPYS